jgi:hypothetical protein
MNFTSLSGYGERTSLFYIEPSIRLDVISKQILRGILLSQSKIPGIEAELPHLLHDFVKHLTS